MSIDLILKPSCGACGSTTELYGSTCKHLTLCVSCGKSMAEKRSKCYECGTPITRLIREYNVRASSSNDKNYFIARFASGLPNFKKKNENKWTLQKEGLQGRQVTDTLREKFKDKPWLLEDETGQFQFHGHLEGTQTATYYLLMLQGKEFVAIPAGSWYNFNKVAQYKQLTLEEAEEKMNNRRKTADGYQRWMMKAANNGAAAFGEVEKFDGREGASGSGRGRKKTTGDDDEANVSDRGDEDEDEESARKNRLGLNKKSGDDDEEGPRGGDLDFDDDDIEKGDDWEHEEIFTDDDEAVGIDPDERDDLAPEIPAPPEIKQADDDISPVIPKKEAPKEEPIHNNSPLKATNSTAGRGTPSTSKSSKGKRKVNTLCLWLLYSVESFIGIQETRAVKDENASSLKSVAHPKGAMPPTSSKSVSAPATGPVTEEEIRAVLLPKTPVTTKDLLAKFRSRLKTKEVREFIFRSFFSLQLPYAMHICTMWLIVKFSAFVLEMLTLGKLVWMQEKDAFSAIMKRISKIQKTNGATNYVVLRDNLA
ncbi:hypothetical protein SASPL_121197 [Salvia splendens]|uniref:Transcription initiation factor IIF subunit alpha n=1 Tax=Salvia splendens TaxID=180675 RepID=A0A8X8XUF3_SALSN|nr:hypothetical protein SASPL_121197 [Salvia splendens]